jgi:AraC-like DNA-binding protein
MVSIRCKMIVIDELQRMGLHHISVVLGEAEIVEELKGDQWKELDKNLRKYGIELLENKKSILIEKIKNVIIEHVHYEEVPQKINISELLTTLIGLEYRHLAYLFSTSHGITIEQFYIQHKIERIKELLMYDELSVTEIAKKMHYSSVAHLSNQFKKMTGLSPSFFKKLKTKTRKSLEEI